MTKKATTSEPIAAQMNANRISVSYDGASKRLILDDVTIDLSQGQFVALVGPNGSGKSTLIRSLSRTLRPYCGVVTLDGRDLYGAVDSRSAARQIAVVPQDTTVAFDFTAREIVSMGRAPHQPRFSVMPGESEEDRVLIERALALTDIGTELANRSINTLSGGERQRVLIARAIAQEARILLLDEPTASLDPRHEADVMALLHGLVKQNSTPHRYGIDQGHVVLAALHDLNLAARYADRVIVLNGGKVVADGTPEEALTPAVIRDVYNVDLWARQNPTNGKPYFVPIQSSLTRYASLHIHIICGAGSGIAAINEQRNSQGNTTVGILDALDPDAEFAQSCGFQAFTVPPFSVVSDADVATLSELIPAEAGVFVTAFPIGQANIANLRAVIALAKKGCRVSLDKGVGSIVAEDMRDEAARLLGELRALPPPAYVADEPDR